MYHTHSRPSSSVGQPYCSSPALSSRIAAEFYGTERRREMIAQAANFRAKRRGFAPGHELEDWRIAETPSDIAYGRAAHSAVYCLYAASARGAETRRDFHGDQ